MEAVSGHKHGAHAFVHGGKEGKADAPEAATPMTAGQRARAERLGLHKHGAATGAAAGAAATGTAAGGEGAAPPAAAPGVPLPPPMKKKSANRTHDDFMWSQQQVRATSPSDEHYNQLAAPEHPMISAPDHPPPSTELTTLVFLTSH